MQIGKSSLLRRSWVQGLLLCLTTPGVMCGTARAQGVAGCVNFDPPEAGFLTEAAKAAGLTLTATSPDAKGFTGPVLVWQATQSPATDVGLARSQWLGDYVRRGGSLVLTLSATPGRGPMELAFLSPTTAWYTQSWSSSRSGAERPVEGVEWDAEMFPGLGKWTLAFPQYFKLQPVNAVERGMQRYERFDWTIPHLGQHALPGTTFWTRPLLNRDWRVRVRGNDINASALVLTGRYGAGRVVVLAGGITALNTGKGDANAWIPILKWATARPGTATPTDLKITPTVTVDRGRRAVNAAVANPTQAPIKVTVIARIATWEHAWAGDVEQELTILPGATATAAMVMPAISPTQYQALVYRDQFDVRVGVLSASGADLLGECRVTANLEPEVRLAIATDELASLNYPFKAPGPKTLFFPNRMGTPIGTYSYAPNSGAHALLTISNGATNLAPLAKAEDETTPDNHSIMALNDEMADAGKIPRSIEGYGMWIGQADKENVVKLTFAERATFNGVTLVGCPAINPGTLVHNVGAASIEVDGQEVAKADGLDARFQTQGRVTLSFPQVSGKEVRIKLPWRDRVAPEPKRGVPWLAEVEITGFTGKVAANLRGHLTVALKDSMTGEVIPVGEQDVAVKGGSVETFSVPFQVPALADTPARYLTLQSELRYTALGQGDVAELPRVELKKETPLMVIQPTHALRPMEELVGKNSWEMGFIVTRGFRNADRIGTGTSESTGSWSTPDDLVWAYSHNLKQIGKGARTKAALLYLSESDFRHYGTPWTSYLNGEEYFQVATPRLVAAAMRSPKWDKSDTVTLGFSDRWDSGPAVAALYGWQELVAFDESLKAGGLPGIQGRTRAEAIADISTRYAGRFRIWQLERYSRAVGNLSDSFAKEQKKLVIKAQGIPIVPSAYEAPLAKTIRGMSDDSTWGMFDDDPCFNTGKQMGYLMVNPGWGLSTLLQWGWNSSVLCNPNWFAPVGTTEPSRRHYYDRAWRASLDAAGRYHSIHTYGYNTNGGTPYTMTPNDWQEWWRLQERHSLLSPDAPFGAGIVMSTSSWADPNRTDFSGGGMGGSELDGFVDKLAQTIRLLHKSGIDISFSTNAASLDKWPDSSPLIICNLSEFSGEEIKSLKKLADRGIRMVAFQGENPLTQEAAQIFGAKPDAFPVDVLAPGTRRSPRPLQFVKNEKGCLVAGSIKDLNEPAVRILAPAFQEALHLPVEFPKGCAGYGFKMGSQHYIVVEDWREEARTISVRYRPATPVKQLRAVNVNDHQPLAARRDKEDWLIDLPMRPGDGSLICVEEVLQ